MGLLIQDLKERRIVRVAIAYFLIAVGLLSSVGILGAALPLPEWTWRLAALATFTLLPFVLVLTWALEDHGPDNLRVARRR
jgi:hypothetical protein